LTIWADAAHILQAARLFLDNVKNSLAKFGDALLGTDRPDALNHAAAKVFLDTFLVVGGVLVKISARNCCPYSRS
jgi:hypothetical protein